MIFRIILVALRNLLRQPFRTFLILQGVIWGTALGVFPPAVINGSMHLAETQASRLGTDRVLVTQDTEAARHFEWSLVDQLRRDPAVRHVTGLRVTVTEDDSLTFLTTDAGVLDARAMRLASGRCFTADEVRDARPVCVLEHEAVKSDRAFDFRRGLVGGEAPIDVVDDGADLDHGGPPPV